MDSHEIQCEKEHANDSVREDSWTEYRKEFLPLGEQVLARRPGANVNQLLQPQVTGLWQGRNTLSDEQLMGTAAGVMTTRAVRRLQETARWVPAALNAMLFTPWSPHLNLPGRLRPQRPAYEEPIEAGTLPGFIEIPTAPTKNPKSETATSTPDDTDQSTKRRRQEVTFQEPLQTSSSAGTAAGTTTDSSMEKTITGCDFTHLSSRVQFLCSQNLRIGSKKIPWNKRDGLAEKLGNWPEVCTSCRRTETKRYSFHLLNCGVFQHRLRYSQRRGNLLWILEPPCTC